MCCCPILFQILRVCEQSADVSEGKGQEQGASGKDALDFIVPFLLGDSPTLFKSTIGPLVSVCMRRQRVSGAVARCAGILRWVPYQSY